MGRFHVTYFRVSEGSRPEHRAMEGESQLEEGVLERNREGDFFFIFRSLCQHQLVQEVLWFHLNVSLLHPRGISWALPVLLLSACAHIISFDNFNSLVEVATLILFNRERNWGKKLCEKFPNKWFETKSEALTTLINLPSYKHTALHSYDQCYAFAFLSVNLLRSGNVFTYFCTLGT